MTTDDPQQSFDPRPKGNASSNTVLSPLDLDSIAATFNRYALATDTADGEMLKSTFVPQAVFIGRIGAAAPSLELMGSTEIAEHVVKTRLQHAYSERHFITNLSAVSLSSKSAHAQAYFLVTRISGNAVINSATGSYQAELIREGDEVWRIVRIDVCTDTALG